MEYAGLKYAKQITAKLEGFSSISFCIIVHFSKFQIPHFPHSAEFRSIDSCLFLNWCINHPLLIVKKMKKPVIDFNKLETLSNKAVLEYLQKLK